MMIEFIGVNKKYVINILLVLLLSVPKYIFGQNNLSILSKDKNTEIVSLIEKFKNDLSKSLGYQVSITQSFFNNSNQIIVEKKSAYIKGINYKKLGQDGFVIKNLDNKHLIISAYTDLGVKFGIYCFLERYMKIKWLYPDKLWINHPLISEFRIPIIDKVFIPSFKTRYFEPINLDQDNIESEWGNRNFLNKYVEYQHNLYKIFEGTDQFAPIVNGKKKISQSKLDQSWQPNFKANGITKYSVNFIRNYFQLNPSHSSLSLGINDSRTYDDGSHQGAQKNFLGMIDFSHDYYVWVKNTIEQVNSYYPDKVYGLLAYNNVASPPTFLLPANVVPFITFERLKWVDGKLKQVDLNNLYNWNKVVNEIGWYDYLYGGNYIVPRTYFSIISEYLKIGHSNKVRHYTAELYPNLIDAPKGWVVSKLLWDVNLNPNDLLKEWCVESFGTKSALYMIQFYKIWDEFWINDVKGTDWWNSGSAAYLLFNNVSYMKSIPMNNLLESESLLNKALINCNSKIQCKRLQEIFDLWQLTKMNYVYFSRGNMNNLNLKDVSKATIFKIMNELNKKEVNKGFIKMMSKYNKY